MTADEARELTAEAMRTDDHAARAWAENWFRVIGTVARKGQHSCTESELPALRMPISQAAKAAALELLRKAGFTVQVIQTGPNEYDNQASW